MARRTVPERIIDAAFVLGTLVVWVWVMDTFPEDYADVTPQWVLTIDPFLGLAACLLIWWRRRFPVAISLVLLPTLVLAGTAYGAALAAVFTVAAHRNWKVSGGITMAYVLVTMPYFYSEANAQTGPAAAVVTGAVMFVAPFAAGVATQSRQELGTVRERERARELVDARRDERRRIAREMHDALSHRISLVSMHAGALAYRVDGAEDAQPLTDHELTEAVGVIRDNAHRALTELGEVLTVLRSGDEEELTQPGLSRIEHLVAEAREAGQPVCYEPGGVPERAAEVRPQLAGTVYRAVQEGLTNARKHAAGAPVTVRLAGEPGSELELEISNPVSDISGELPGIGAGLTGLAERVRLEDGRLRHGPADGTFTLAIRLPWSA